MQQGKMRWLRQTGWHMLSWRIGPIFGLVRWETANEAVGYVACQHPDGEARKLTLTDLQSEGRGTFIHE